MIRAAVIRSSDAQAVAAYLPANYSVVGRVVVEGNPVSVIIAGTDEAGWTLDDYVLPRLASGLHFGHEVQLGEVQ